MGGGGWARDDNRRYVCTGCSALVQHNSRSIGPCNPFLRFADANGPVVESLAAGRSYDRTARRPSEGGGASELGATRPRGASPTPERRRGINAAGEKRAKGPGRGGSTTDRLTARPSESVIARQPARDRPVFPGGRTSFGRMPRRPSVFVLNVRQRWRPAGLSMLCGGRLHVAVHWYASGHARA